MSVGEGENESVEKPAQQPPDDGSGETSDAVGNGEEPVVIDEQELELAGLRRDLEQSSARLRAVSKAYTELQNEMKAFRERMEQRAKFDSELLAYDQVRTFFDPVMNLKRSIHSAGEDAGSLQQGLEMVLTQFMDALKKLGLAEVPGVGATFDPNMHEALGVQPVANKEQDGKVLVVHATGYKVRDRLLQPAQVVIGKYEEAAGEA